MEGYGRLDAVEHNRDQVTLLLDLANQSDGGLADLGSVAGHGAGGIGELPRHRRNLEMRAGQDQRRRCIDVVQQDAPVHKGVDQTHLAAPRAGDLDGAAAHVTQIETVRSELAAAQDQRPPHVTVCRTEPANDAYPGELHPRARDGARQAGKQLGQPRPVHAAPVPELVVVAGQLVRLGGATSSIRPRPTAGNRLVT